MRSMSRRGRGLGVRTSARLSLRGPARASENKRTTDDDYRDEPAEASSRHADVNLSIDRRRRGSNLIFSIEFYFDR